MLQALEEVRKAYLYIYAAYLKRNRNTGDNDIIKMQIDDLIAQRVPMSTSFI